MSSFEAFEMRIGVVALYLNDKQAFGSQRARKFILRNCIPRRPRFASFPFQYQPIDDAINLILKVAVSFEASHAIWV